MQAEQESVFDLSTREFAKLNKVKPSAIRNQLYRRGEYFGAVPRRLPNGRLVWPNPTTKEPTK